MKTYRYIPLYALFLFIMITPQAFPVAFEEREPRYEKAILVPKGARPALKEEYPRRQLVVDRIKARHRHALSIPFFRSWNTASVTALTGLEQEPELDGDFELGFALHSQRLRVGALRNKEYFRKETEGFPKRWYRPFQSMDYIDRPEGYMTTSFVHLAARRSRRKYTDYSDFSDRVKGILNVIMSENKQLTLMARRDMQRFNTEGMSSQPRIRNTASISYKRPGEGANELELDGSSIWSTLTDSAGRDFQYISGLGSVTWGRSLRSDFYVDIKADFKISTLREEIYENTETSETKTLETRKSGWLEVSNIISPAELLRLKLNLSGLYDSEYEGYFTPSFEIALVHKIVQANVGVRKRIILPDHDEIYWPSKFVKVNDNLQPEDFWEAYSSLNVDIIARMKFAAEASYSQPESRITWQQLSQYIWEPVNAETSEALTGQASLTLNIVRSLNTFASFKYQYFDNQLFDPEIIADAGFSYGNPVGGSITLGASFWNFQPLESTEPPEDFAFVYIRITKSFLNLLTFFIDGRYTLNDDAVLYYRGAPQAGRIVSFGASMVFGGLD